MKRGDLVTVVLPGAYGKPRPALIIQSDLFDLLPAVTVLPVTGDLRDGLLLRVRLQPEPGTGLQRPSQVCEAKPHPPPGTFLQR